MEICLDLIANFMIAENLAEKIEKKLAHAHFPVPFGSVWANSPSQAA